MKNIKVTLRIKVKGKAERFIRQYVKLKAEKVDEVPTIAAGQFTEGTDADKKKAANAYIVDCFNYGHDLKLRGKERAAAEKEAEGPAKQIAKSVDMLVSNGMPREEAHALIIAQRTAAGLAV